MIDLYTPPPLWTPPKPAIIRAVEDAPLPFAAILPGMVPVIAGANLSPTFFAIAESTTASVTVPSGVQSGDIGVLIDIAMNGSTTIPTAVTPTGYTNLANNGSTQAAGGGNSATRRMISVKLLTSADAGATVTGMDAIDTKVYLVFRPVSGLYSGFPNGTWQYQATENNPAQQDTDLTALNGPMIFLGIAYEQGTIGNAFSVQTPAFDATVGTDDMTVGYYLYEVGEAGQNHAVDQADLGNVNLLSSGYFRLS